MKTVFLIPMLAVTLMAGAETLFPRGGESRVVDRKAEKVLQQNGHTLFRLTTELDRALAAKVDVKPVGEGVEIDTDAAFRAGAIKVNLRTGSLAVQEFSDKLCELTLTVEGPAGAQMDLYFEGVSPDRPHYYKARKVTLSGKREQFRFREALPAQMRELHLRFDILSPGCFRIGEYGIEVIKTVPAWIPGRSGELICSLEEVSVHEGSGSRELRRQERTVLQATAEPVGISPELFVVKPESGGIAVDTTKAFASGAKKVRLKTASLPGKTFPEELYELSVALEGPAGARMDLYFEGVSPENTHYYKFRQVVLSGKREVFRFEDEIPTQMRELHLRFDFLTPGLFRVGDIGFRALSLPPPREENPKLLFYAPFDGTPEAAVAGGSKVPEVAEKLAFADGVSGQALRSTKKAGSLLRYALAGNLRPETGTISLWFKPEWKETIPRTSNPEKWQTLLTMDRPEPRVGSGAVWVWSWGSYARGEISEPLDSYIQSGLPLEPGRWHHLALTWGAKGARFFVDGREVFCHRDNDSPLKGWRRASQESVRSIRSFFVGGFGGAEQADGLIDELKIYSAPLDPQELSRETGRFLKLDLDLLTGYFAPDGPRRLIFRAFNRSAEPLPVVWRLTAPDGRRIAGSDGMVTVPAAGALLVEPGELPELAPGEYWLTLSGGGCEVRRPIQMFDDQNPWKSDGTAMKLTEVERITPEPGLAADRFLSLGTLRTATLDGRRYLEAGTEPGDRFAIRFRLPETKSAYLVEWDYPDDRRRTADVIVQSSMVGRNEYELQVGYCTGDEYRNSGRMLTQRNIYFPHSTDVSLVFMTARKDAPAAVGEIRIYRIENGLPPAQVRVADPVEGHTRSLGIYYEDPALNYGFAADGSGMPGLDVLLDRLVAYMKYSGQNLLAYPAVWYHGLIDDRYNPRDHAPNFLDAFLTRFDREGLDFMATMNRNSMEFPRGLVNKRSIESGALHPTAISIWNTGKPNPGGWHNTPPNFNILHPDVQKQIVADVDRILEIGARHPSFKGIVLHLPQHVMLWFGDLRAGYNDYAIEQFEKETGIKVPVDRSEPMRGRLYADWLLANAREPWVDWRCRRLAAFYRSLADRISARRSDLRLVINSMIPVSEIQAADYTTPDFVERRNREAGLDPNYYRGAKNIVLDQTLYPADYRHRAGQRLKAENYARLRVIDTRPEFYKLLEGAVAPWIHMHDRYWESAIGNAQERLSAPWFKEQTWRVSTLNPAGFHAMRHYVLPLRYTDLLGISKGGFLIGTYGMEEYLTAFAKAFRALPAKVFDDLETGSGTLKARRLEHDGSTWFYVVNTTDVPARAEVRVAGEVTDLVSGRPVSAENGGFSLEMQPYQLRSFRTPGSAAVRVEVR